jgi:hypothetical protein
MGDVPVLHPLVGYTRCEIRPLGCSPVLASKKAADDQIDIQTLPWPEIVRLIGEIRKHNPITSLSNGQTGALADMVGNDLNSGKDKKLDAHDVAKWVDMSPSSLLACGSARRGKIAVTLANLAAVYYARKTT